MSKVFLKVVIRVFFLAGIFWVLASSAHAATNINSAVADHWAWNDIIGWIDFYNTQTVNVGSQNLTGYASSSAGEISLDCHTTSIGNICDGTNDYQVINNGAGDLSGWGWNDLYGWISFCGGQGTSDCPGGVGYRVLIDPNNGDFSNYAWNDVIGWISFNCVNTGDCGMSNYKVNTSWFATSTVATLDSSIFDTGVAAGAELNSVLWHGSEPAGAEVSFQFAVSDASAGPWAYIGPDGTSNTSYRGGPNISLKLNYTHHNNKRYFRYRVFLQSNQSQTISPRVDDIIVNWSP